MVPLQILENLIQTTLILSFVRTKKKRKTNYTYLMSLNYNHINNKMLQIALKLTTLGGWRTPIFCYNPLSYIGVISKISLDTLYCRESAKF